ncbi:phycobilisome protein [Geminocystis sp. CENA526]|uniref:phycobilisome protein n=1 Tax=Geminocystis sp. CENA526 TaxID=1355871 RepID=UPI003D6F5691
MYPELQALIHEAEHQYLQADNLYKLNQEVSTLKDRLNAYKILRDEEISIFQEVADKAVKQFPQEDTKKIENVIRHWILITRYCGMAMLLNNPEFLQHRLLEWLTDIVQAHESQSLFPATYSLLIVSLGQVLAEEGLQHLQPFLSQANDYLSNVPVLNA